METKWGIYSLQVCAHEKGTAGGRCWELLLLRAETPSGARQAGMAAGNRRSRRAPQSHGATGLTAEMAQNRVPLPVEAAQGPGKHCFQPMAAFCLGEPRYPEEASQQRHFL